MTEDAAPARSARFLADIRDWPDRWKGDRRDVPLGEEIVRAVRPFLEVLVSSELADSTVRRHVDNIWLLGGEIVRQAWLDPAVRRLTGRELLLGLVDEEGGPLLHGGATEQEQRSFDGTCRKLFKFLGHAADGA